MKRLKSVTAGLLHYDFLVPVTVPTGTPGQRGAKRQPSSITQIFANLKNSWWECELRIAANFAQGDLVVTLTYDDLHLPKTKQKADRVLYEKFIRKLRQVRKRRGQELRCLYVTEGYHGRCSCDGFLDDTEWEDHRLHHHLVLNGVGSGDMEEIKSLWIYGCYVRIEPLDIHYYRELAKYLTKEARDFGRGKVGERTWKCTRNLKPATVEYDDVRDNITLAAPIGAVDYEHIDNPNPGGYGEIIWTRYLLIPDEVAPMYTYTRGRRPQRYPPHL